MPYNSGTGAYERRSTTVIDATPDGDTVAVAIDVKLDQGIDDYVVDLNHHKTNGNHYPATSVHTDSRFLRQSPAGAISWADGVVAADAALKDFSNVDATIGKAALGISASSETNSGLVELATSAEAEAGEDTSRAVTPAGLKAGIGTMCIKRGTAVTATGLVIEFLGIPDGVKRVDVIFGGVSLSGGSYGIIQLGDPSGFKTSGYNSGGAIVSSEPGGVALSGTSGILMGSGAGNGNTTSGIVRIERLTSLEWVYSTCGGVDNLYFGVCAGGRVTLDGQLSKLQVLTLNGTDEFDSGKINISWE